MAATLFLPANPRLTGTRSTITDTRIRRNRQRAVVTMSAQRGESGEGKSSSVDENMVVLKMRIKRMKAIEGGGGEGAAPPEEWKEWEKRVFTNYQEGVSDSVEMLHAFLMKTRPSVAVGMVALMALAVPLSSSAVVANIIKVARGVLAGCHVIIDIDF